MVQLSRRPLKSEVKEEILENLWLSFVAVSKKEDVVDFVGDILSPTERLMLAKRLMIALLLIRGWKYEDIQNFLKVSGGTINAVRSNIERGGRGFKFAAEKLEKKKSFNEIIQKIEKTLNVIPPIVGRGRWLYK